MDGGLGWPLRPLTETVEEGSELIVNYNCVMDIEYNEEERKGAEGQ